MNIIDVRKLLFKYKTYAGDREDYVEHTALSDLSLTIKKGDFVGILGHNGSGKSTLAKQLAALLKPTGGVIYVKGMDTADEKSQLAIRKTAGMVFQNPDNQLIGNSVEEDVAFGLENLGVPADEMARRIERTLAATGMSTYREASPNALSGGQKQRVALSGILAMEPECIIFDEPTAMIDPEGVREVLDAIYALNREKGITIIYITHFLAEVEQADYLYVMCEGRLTMEGRPAQLFCEPEKLLRNHLELPFAVACVRDLRERGITVPQDIYTRAQLAAWVSGQKMFASRGIDREADAKPREEGKAGEGDKDGKLGETRERTKQKEANTRNAFETRQDFAEKKKRGIRLEHVSYRYQKRGAGEGHYALRDISLSIAPGEFVAVIGQTGSGKSTLIQHFNGLLIPQEGTIFFDGEDVGAKGYAKSELRRRVALCFQYPEYQLFEENVLKDIAFGPKNLGCDKAESEERARRAMAQMGLPADLEKVSPFALSGGQKRKAALAGILAMEPEYLILDEPAAGLDAPGKRNLFALLKKLNEEHGITIVLVSHNMDEVARYAHRVIAMAEGRIRLDGTPQEVFSRKETLEAIGLTRPQSVAFYQELVGDDTAPGALPLDGEILAKWLCAHLQGGMP